MFWISAQLLITTDVWRYYTSMSDDDGQESASAYYPSGHHEGSDSHAGTAHDQQGADTGSGHGGGEPDVHIGATHERQYADSESGHGGDTYPASMLQPAPQSCNGTRLPGSFLPPDSTYRQSDANSAAILAEPDGRLCSTDNCKRFSRFSSTDFEWPACCTPCYSHDPSSHSRTCDAS